MARHAGRNRISFCTVHRRRRRVGRDAAGGDYPGRNSPRRGAAQRPPDRAKCHSDLSRRRTGRRPAPARNRAADARAPARQLRRRAAARPASANACSARWTCRARTLESTVAAARAKVEGRADLPRRLSRTLGASSSPKCRNAGKKYATSNAASCARSNTAPSPRVELFEERSACLLATDAARTAELKRRYDLP